MVQATGGTASWCDRLLDGLVLLLATWTVSYHVCVVLRLGTTVALVLWLAVLVVSVVVLRRTSDDDPDPLRATTSETNGSPVPGPRVPDRVLVGVTLAAAALASVSVALSAWWVLVWPAWVVASLTGTTWAWRRARKSLTVVVADGPTSEDRWTPLGVLAWAVGLGLLSMWTLRANPDDLFYVNVSQWVAGHGEFPVKDTLFSNLAY